MRRECLEKRFEKEDEESVAITSDRTVTEACDFESHNVNLRSAKDVKWWPCDWATCREMIT